MSLRQALEQSLFAFGFGSGSRIAFHLDLAEAKIPVLVEELSGVAAKSAGVAAPSAPQDGDAESNAELPPPVAPGQPLPEVIAGEAPDYGAYATYEEGGYYAPGAGGGFDGEPYLDADDNPSRMVTRAFVGPDCAMLQREAIDFFTELEESTAQGARATVADWNTTQRRNGHWMVVVCAEVAVYPPIGRRAQDRAPAKKPSPFEALAEDASAFAPAVEPPTVVAAQSAEMEADATLAALTAPQGVPTGQEAAEAMPQLAE